VAVAGDAKLLEVVGALHAGGGFADLLDGGEQESDEDGYDGDHHQQLDQREATHAIGLERTEHGYLGRVNRDDEAGNVPVPMKILFGTSGGSSADTPLCEADPDPDSLRDFQNSILIVEDRGGEVKGKKARTGERASVPAAAKNRRV